MQSGRRAWRRCAAACPERLSTVYTCSRKTRTIETERPRRSPTDFTMQEDEPEMQKTRPQRRQIALERSMRRPCKKGLPSPVPDGTNFKKPAVNPIASLYGDLCDAVRRRDRPSVRAPFFFCCRSLFREKPCALLCLAVCLAIHLFARPVACVHLYRRLDWQAPGAPCRPVGTWEVAACSGAGGCGGPAAAGGSARAEP